jgi:predicted Zn-ribbon and HTH transcriptional regulator
MTHDALILTYVSILLGVIGLLTLMSDRRRRRFRRAAVEDRIFRCEKCGYVYTDDPDVDRSRCSQCGTLNACITF